MQTAYLQNDEKKISPVGLELGVVVGILEAYFVGFGECLNVEVSVFKAYQKNNHSFVQYEYLLISSFVICI